MSQPHGLLLKHFTQKTSGQNFQFEEAPTGGGGSPPPRSDCGSAPCRPPSSPYSSAPPARNHTKPRAVFPHKRPNQTFFLFSHAECGNVQITPKIRFWTLPFEDQDRKWPQETISETRDHSYALRFPSPKMCARANFAPGSQMKDQRHKKNYS